MSVKKQGNDVVYFAAGFLLADLIFNHGRITRTVVDVLKRIDRKR